MTDRIGQQLGNYHLIRLLGQGGFAEVYLGEHTVLGTTVAIKVLHARVALEDMTQFQQEARILASLKHPHIVRILDFGIEECTPYLMMDYAPNGTLRARHFKGNILPVTTVVEYVKQVARALQYAHERKVVHRDIKPENMLISEHNEILLCDFGIALITQNSGYRDTTDMLGTITYMAPEQIAGFPCAASDQYALGILAYEWLCGKRPFYGSFTEVAVQQSVTPPPPLRQHLPTLSPDIEKVVLIALSKRPEDRFASVRAFANALEQASQVALPTKLARLVPVSSPLPVPSNPPAPLTSAAMLLPDQPVELSDMLTMRVSQAEAKPIPVTEVVPDRPAVPSDAFMTQVSQAETLSVPATEAPLDRLAVPSDAFMTQVNQAEAKPIPATEVAPDLSALVKAAYKAKVSRRGVLIGLGMVATTVIGAAVFVVPGFVPPRGYIFTYRGHSGAVFAVAWSPHRMRIASGSYDQTVQVWHISNGGNAFTYKGHSGGVWSVAWSPDGRRIASGSADKTVQVWNARNGSNVFTYKGHSGVVLSVAWSPDGKRIVSGSDDRTVQVWNVDDTRNVFTFEGHSAQVNAVAWSPDGQRIASGSVDKTVQVWNASDGSNVFTYKGHSGVVLSVAWSPDGKHIASGSADKTVHVWNASDGSDIFTYKGHSDWVGSVAWSSDGKRIASSSGDTTAQVWNASDGNNVFTYTGHSASVYTVGWLPDANQIVSGSYDKTVQVWHDV